MSENSENKLKIIRPQKGFQEKFVRSNVDFVVGGAAMGVGKLAPLSSKVLTPNGWVEMRDIKVGSIITTPFDGDAVVTHVFPQGVKDIYEVETYDGRKAYCGLEHLWTIRSKSQIEKHRRNPQKWDWVKTVETSDIIKLLEEDKPVYIPINNAVEFKEKDYVIPPYILGVMLGDGCLTKACFKDGDRCFKISNSEIDIIDKIRDISESYKVVERKSNCTKCFYTQNISKYRSYLKEKGLNTYSYNKYIPEEYLFGSIEQRRELLYGLMDTDGSVGRKNRYTFSTTSRKLKDGFIELCRSLGYIATSNDDKRVDKYTNKECFRITIQTDDIIFSSKKHLDKYNSYDHNRKYARTNDHVRVGSVKLVRQEEAQCIVVDSPKHLYICDDYMTTHNSFAALLMAAEPSLDPNFRMVFIRKNIQDTKVGGGGVDEIEKIYGDAVKVKRSENPRATFKNGAFVDFTHMDNENPEDVLERVKGWQYGVIYFDEGTGFEWSTIRLAFSRNRSSGKWNGKIRITCNPKKNHWLRIWLDWYIDPITGYPIPERDGVVRYFYIKGDNIKDVAFGDTPEEVYEQCKHQIDGHLKKLNARGGKFTYKDFIKTTTFYGGSLDMNKELLKTNPGYVASVAAMGEKQALANLAGNWNVDILDESESPIPSWAARECLMADPQVNGNKWITADLADYGTDNFIALVWDGLHIYDMLVLGKTTPAQNANQLKLLAAKHDIPDSHIVFDGTNGRYILDYIPDAIPFISSYPPVGLYARAAANRKDEAYLRLKFLITERKISFSNDVANRKYYHAKLKTEILIETEFIEECSVVRFQEQPGGKKRLATKKEMNQMLGKGRSMDLLDAIAMRMFPLAEYQYGTELEKTAIDQRDEIECDSNESVYEDSFWA